MDADAGGPLDDAGSDLEQACPEGRELGPGERHPAGRGIAQGEHQPVGRGAQDEAELVSERALAGGPVRGELALVQLDEVLGLAAGAVNIGNYILTRIDPRHPCIDLKRAKSYNLFGISRHRKKRGRRHEQLANPRPGAARAGVENRLMK